MKLYATILRLPKESSEIILSRPAQCPTRIAGRLDIEKGKSGAEGGWIFGGWACAAS